MTVSWSCRLSGRVLGSSATSDLEVWRLSEKKLMCFWTQSSVTAAKGGKMKPRLSKTQHERQTELTQTREHTHKHILTMSVQNGPAPKKSITAPQWFCLSLMLQVYSATAKVILWFVPLTLARIHFVIFLHLETSVIVKLIVAPCHKHKNQWLRQLVDFISPQSYC